MSGLRALAVGAVAAIAIGSCAAATPPEAAVVTVDASAGAGVMRTQLDTQIVYPAVIDQDMPSAAEHLALFAAGRSSPLRVRLLLSTDGAYVTPDHWHKPTLPAGWTRGDWDFVPLDLLVGDVYRARAEPVVDIGSMPDWMWNCANGQPVDPTFATFADYAADLVAYYNTGSFVAEDGRRVSNPAGTAHRVATWELWNEPNYQALSCLRNGAAATPPPPLTPAQYLTMWDSVAARMRAVDPTIRLAGPSTTAGVTGQRPDYLELLMTRARIKPDVVTFHAYGSYHPDETDGCLFENAPPSGRSCFQGGIPALVDGLRRVRTWAPDTETWLTELNVLAAYGNDERARNWSALGAAWEASAFVRLGASGAGSLFHYSFVHPGGNQFSVFDWTNGPTFGTPLLPYWTAYYLARLFPPGSTLVKATAGQRGIDTLAVRMPGGEVRVLVVNRRVASLGDVGGAGVANAIRVSLSGAGTPASVTLWQLDGETDLRDGPSPRAIAASSDVTVRFAGYGVAIVEFR